LRVIDIPGHERLRGKFFDEYKGTARGVIYVIDSVTFQKDIQDVAE
jgi:signal recognition particle receptor subunit beta